MTPEQAANTIREALGLSRSVFLSGEPYSHQVSDAIVSALAALKVLEDAANERDALAADRTHAGYPTDFHWYEKAKSEEARAEALTRALRWYADLEPDEIPYADTVNDPPDIGRPARAALAAYDAAKETT